MHYLSLSDQAKQCYHRFADENLKNLSEMCDEQRLFLITLLLQYKPSKILELGVSAGGSSALILNTINDSLSESKLYSIDLSEQWYKNPEKKTGFMVSEHYTHLMQPWTLYTGKPAFSFMDKIGHDVNFCFIDTAHINPGEILDFLMVFPYLSKKCVVVFHDITLHLNNTPQNVTTSLLMSAVRGTPYLLEISEQSHRPFHNIGAVVLDGITDDALFPVFNLLTLPWSYGLKEQDFQEMLIFFRRFYPESLVSIFIKSREYYQNVYFSS